MTRPTKHPAPPSDLSGDARKLWALVHEGWAVDDAGRAVLAIALRAGDRGAAARTLIAREGMVVASGKKGTRQHPAVSILKDSEQIALKAWRQLGLQGAPAGVPGRPAGAV
jgi:hypothetical protein